MSTIADFNNTTRTLRYEVGVDLNGDGVAEQTYEHNVQYFTVFETVDDIAGVKIMQSDCELFLNNPSTTWSQSGIKTYASVKVSNDNWSTEHQESIFTGSTLRNNTVPVNDVQIKATTYNDDYLDRKVTRQVFEGEDIATIMQSLLEQVGVDPADISLAGTGYTVPVYFISDNFPIRYYIDQLAKAALQVVGFNRSGVFSSNSLIKNDFDGGYPTPDVTVTLDDIIQFKNRQIRSNNYYNDITVRAYTYERQDDIQFYYNTELSGYSVAPGEQLFFELELEEVNIISLNPLSRRFSGNVRGLLGTMPFLGFSYFEFFNADFNGTPDTADTRVVSTSIVPGSKPGQDKLLLVFENTSATTTYFLKQIILNGSVVQRKPPYETSIVNDAAIVADGKRLPLVFETDAVTDSSRAETIKKLLEINLMTRSNVYTFEIRGRPQLEAGSVIQFQDRNETNLTGVVTEIDSEFSKTSGYTQYITARVIPELGAYFGLDDTTTGLDDANYQLL